LLAEAAAVGRDSDGAVAWWFKPWQNWQQEETATAGWWMPVELDDRSIWREN
jgi:hypothetical protein